MPIEMPEVQQDTAGACRPRVSFELVPGSPDAESLSQRTTVRVRMALAPEGDYVVTVEALVELVPAYCPNLLVTGVFLDRVERVTTGALGSAQMNCVSAAARRLGEQMSITTMRAGLPPCRIPNIDWRDVYQHVPGAPTQDHPLEVSVEMATSDR